MKNKDKTMDVITKYFGSIIYLIIATIPSCIGLLVFDHSMISKSDLLQTAGMWVWVAVCLSYTAVFVGLYFLNMPLIHPLIWRRVNVNYSPSKDDWKPVVIQMFIYSLIAGLITYHKHGNYLHFIGNSLIVAVSVNVFLLISYYMLERITRNE